MDTPSISKNKAWSALLFFQMFFVAAIFTGCSGTPSESTGRKVIEKRIEDQNNYNSLHLVRFTKLNGVRNGITYQMEFEAELLFTDNGSWIRGSSVSPTVQFGFTSQQYSGSAMGQLMGSLEGAVKVRTGEKQTFKSIITFTKTERGWRTEDGHIY